jgi:hypothetical protein
VAVALDRVAFRHLDGPSSGDAADIVAPEIEQHEVFGAFLRIGEEAGGVVAVFGLGCPARAGSRDGADGHFTVADAHEDFGAGANQCEAG